ncbi:MAG TPA: right-handed parallel beta-helix repeat-containing protein [Pyrinomonadaceae bacterium]|nr:right-handed parallel beta-helix repeat-containing protein [Pyrinomonadaceae bacterium]
MNNLRLTLRASAVFALALLFVSGAQAQAQRTWVSGDGNDVNPCSFPAPCKTFAGAISKTATGGEITVKDAGGFGPVIIRKSITIDGTGVPASILASQGFGITIDIPRIASNIRLNPRVVRIRGLSINGVGTGIHGINVIGASKVSVEDCVIDGFRQNGINVQSGTLYVRNTTIRNNGSAGINATGGAQAGISDTSLVYNGTGLAGAVVKHCCVVLFGNNNGDPPPPSP